MVIIGKWTVSKYYNIINLEGLWEIQKAKARWELKRCIFSITVRYVSTKLMPPCPNNCCSSVGGSSLLATLKFIPNFFSLSDYFSNLKCSKKLKGDINMSQQNS